jgi:transposase
MIESDCSSSMTDSPVKPVRSLTCRPIEMKRWIVEQTLVPGASVAQVARRHGVNANQLFGWRKQYREGSLVSKRPRSYASPPPSPDGVTGQALVRLGVIDHEAHPPAAPISLPLPAAPAVAGANSTASPSIEIELPDGIKLRVTPDALHSVLAAVKALA